MSAYVDAPALGTEWNSASLLMWRLHNIQTIIAEAQMTENYAKWISGLWRYYLELAPNMHDDEQKEAKKLIEAAEKAENGAGVVLTSDVFRKCVAAESYLSRIMGERGMRVPLSKDPRLASRGKSF